MEEREEQDQSCVQIPVQSDPGNELKQCIFIMPLRTVLVLGFLLQLMREIMSEILGET